MEVALNKDIEKKYLEAVNCYENEINSNQSPDIDTYINLAFIYWEFATDLFAFNIPNNIPEEWSLIGGNRYSKIIEMGLEKYPDNLELHFWKRYFLSRLFEQDFTEQDCEQLIKTYVDNKSLVPYFSLYLFNREKYKGQRDKLIEECDNKPTAKYLYIKSIIS